jgi:hypothetical protein
MFMPETLRETFTRHITSRVPGASAPRTGGGVIVALNDRPHAFHRAAHFARTNATAGGIVLRFERNRRPRKSFNFEVEKHQGDEVVRQEEAAHGHRVVANAVAGGLLGILIIGGEWIVSSLIRMP